MGLNWVVRYIPSDEQLVVPEHTAEWIIGLLLTCGTTRQGSGGGLRGHRAIPLDTTAGFENRARTVLLQTSAYLSLYLEVEEYPFPLPELDYAGQRICRACGRTVPASAECGSCGAEEDPTTWRIGPPLLLYRRSTSVSLHFDESGIALLELPAPRLDSRIRELFEGKLEAVESRLDCSMKPIVQVLE